MYTTLTTLINLLDSGTISDTTVIEWGSPVPSFGDLARSKIATLGLNPSNREFVDDMGNELKGKYRRFHTLNSLGLKSWSDIDARHLQLILDSCQFYFRANPYDRWFKILDLVLSGTNSSYYSRNNVACHLDLIPFATLRKWNELSLSQRSTLLTLASDTLAVLLRDSPIRILVLNGKSVIQIFQEISGVQLEKEKIPAWSLPRRAKQDVIGEAYRGVTTSLSNIQLGRELLILGFNHNLQSSFGVTTNVLLEIRKWIANVSVEFV